MSNTAWDLISRINFQLKIIYLKDVLDFLNGVSTGIASTLVRPKGISKGVAPSTRLTGTSAGLVGSKSASKRP